MSDTTADDEQLRRSARALVMRRHERAAARGRVRTALDAMAAEARRYLGAAFTQNDPVTRLPIALVVRSDERLPDDYEQQSPRPSTETLNRLIVEVLGRSLSIEIDDGGRAQAQGDTPNVQLDAVSAVRIAQTGPNAATFLVLDASHGAPNEIPFVRALADLIDAAAQAEAHYAVPARESALDTAEPVDTTSR